jgi:hypothetical protein
MLHITNKLNWHWYEKNGSIDGWILDMPAEQKYDM